MSIMSGFSMGLPFRSGGPLGGSPGGGGGFGPFGGPGASGPGDGFSRSSPIGLEGDDDSSGPGRGRGRGRGRGGDDDDNDGGFIPPGLAKKMGSLPPGNPGLRLGEGDDDDDDDDDEQIRQPAMIQQAPPQGATPLQPVPIQQPALPQGVAPLQQQVPLQQQLAQQAPQVASPFQLTPGQAAGLTPLQLQEVQQAEQELQGVFGLLASQNIDVGEVLAVAGL